MGMNPWARDHQVNSGVALPQPNSHRKQLSLHRTRGAKEVVGALDSECMEEGLAMTLER